MNTESKALDSAEKKIIKAVEVLKREFVGIDSIIDGVVANIKSWYMFPELYKHPLVINLFGMTGTGKTSMVKRLCELIDLESDFFYFNFAEIGECTSWEIEDKIMDELSDEKSNRVFVYDEFQYGATIKQNGEENDKKSGMKPFWELLDTGKMHKRNSYWDTRAMLTAAQYMTLINLKRPMEIVNGVWTNSAECLSEFDEFEVRKFWTVFDMRTIDVVSDSKTHDGGTAKKERGVFFLNDNVWNQMSKAYNRFMADSPLQFELYDRVREMNAVDIINLLVDLYEKSSKGYDMDFHNSVIFVMANVDEAYTMALSVNPDMSPDMFHEATKKITIVDIKEALKHRFRNEQIARLGNIHHIYPSFSSSSFKEIIRRNMVAFCEEAETLTGYKTTFNKSIVNLIYKESVFPTHGTRPIFSTISDFVRSKMADMMIDIYENKYQVDSVEYGASGSTTTIKLYGRDNEHLTTLKYKNKIRVESLRKGDKGKNQAIVALHESGHFIVYNILTSKFPEKLVSVTADKNSGGFMLKKEDDNAPGTFQSALDDITVILAGRAAELMVMGHDDTTSGASSDISTATSMASRLFRNYGFENTYTTIHGVIGGPEDMDLIKDSDKQLYDINVKIKALLDKCFERATEILSKSREALKESALYLSTHSAMPFSIMRKISEKIPQDLKQPVKDDTYYLEKIRNL